MASYTALAAANNLSSATTLKIQAFETMVQMKAVPQSVFFNIPAQEVNDFSQDDISVPGNFLLKKAPGQDKSHQVVFSMLNYLSNNETKGNGVSQIDNIEDPAMKAFTGYYNDVSHATKLDQYGINSIDVAPYIDQARIATLLGVHHAEIMDYYMEFALIFGRSPNLLETPISLGVRHHRNTFIKGLNYQNQPYSLYHANAAYWAGVISSSMDLAQALHASTKTELACDIGFLLAMSKWANYIGKLRKFSIGGRKSYIAVLPTSQVEYMMNPANTDNPMYYGLFAAGLNSVEQTIPGAKMRVNDVIVIENGRAPTAKTYGTNSGSGSGSGGGGGFPGTMNPTTSVSEVKFCKAGDTDDRHTTGNIMEAGFFLGSEGMAEIDAGLHTEYEIQDFKRIKATGWFNTYGLNRADFDIDTGTAASLANFSSAVMWFGKQDSNWNNG